MKNQPDPSNSAEHADECCMSCGARLEEGEPGKCNRCGGDFNAGRKQASVQIQNLAKMAAGADVRLISGNPAVIGQDPEGYEQFYQDIEQSVRDQG